MINIAVEGESDREAAHTVVKSAGRSVFKVAIVGGKSRLDPKIPKYSAAAKSTHWVVFRDSDNTCPVELRRHLCQNNSRAEPTLQSPHRPHDDRGLAAGRCRWFRRLLSHATRATREVRESLVSKGATGPLYVSKLNEFAATRWDVHTAAENCPSLARAIAAIKALPSDHRSHP